MFYATKLLYANSTRTTATPTPYIKHWNSEKLMKIEEFEIASGTFESMVNFYEDTTDQPTLKKNIKVSKEKGMKKCFNHI